MSKYDDPHFEMPDPPGADVSGWCSACGEPCYGAEINIGIGSYEYWGQKCIDRRMVVVSHCCNESILDHQPNEAEETDEEAEVAH